MDTNFDHSGHPQPIQWFQKWKSDTLTLGI